MNQAISIREIAEFDHKEIAQLSKQLGYDIVSDTVKEQIRSILESKDHMAYVAIRDKTIVGYIHWISAMRLTSISFLEIVGLVVSSVDRGRGIGTLLVSYLETKADGVEVRVRCNSKRKDAHTFYSKLGYIESKEQKVFSKRT